MKDKPEFKKIKTKVFSIFLSLSLVISSGIMFGSSYALEQRDDGSDRFTANPDTVYLITNISGRISEYNKGKGTLKVVSTNQMEDGTTFVQKLQTLYQKYAKSKRQININALGISQDGKFAYVIANFDQLYRDTGCGIAAIFKYDIEKQKWSVETEYNDFKDNAPAISRALMGAYDPVSHSYIFAGVDGRGEYQGFEPSKETLKGKVNVRFWRYNIKEKKIYELGYFQPNIENLIGYPTYRPDGSLVNYSSNGDIAVFSDGTVKFVMQFRNRDSGRTGVSIYKISSESMEQAMKEKNKLNKFEPKVVLSQNSDNTGQEVSAFNGVAIDSEGNVFVNDKDKIFKLKETGLEQVLDVETPSKTNPNGGANYNKIKEEAEKFVPEDFDKKFINWSDAAVVPGRALMVRYVDEAGNSIAPYVYPMVNLLNGVKYNTRDIKDYIYHPDQNDESKVEHEYNKDFRKNYIIYKGKFYQVTDKLGDKTDGSPSDPEQGVIMDRNFEVVYVYKEVSSKGEPKVSKDIQGKSQTGQPEFTNGNNTPIKINNKNLASLVDKNGNLATKFPAVKDGKAIGEYTIDQNTGVVTFQPNPDFVGMPEPAVVQVKDELGNKVEASYTPTVTPVEPIGIPKETKDIKGKTQIGKVEFKPGNPAVPMDESVPAKLKNKDGKLVTLITIKGEGKYTVSKDVTVTFVPDKDFVGVGTGVIVVRQDINGTKAEAKYTPIVTAVETTFVDESGKEIPGYNKVISGEPVGPKKIPGYTFIKTVGPDKDGNVKHIYKKSVITEWVDEDGNPLKDAFSGKDFKKPEEFKGYYLNDTKKLKGKRIYVYAKKVIDKESNKKPDPKKTPKDDSSNTTPKTGETNNMEIYGIGAILSILGLAFVLYRKKSKL